MKKNTILLNLLLLTAASFSQGKEKIKGSKIVTISQEDIKEFETIEIEDNIDVFLVKGDKSAIEIEADDNLHDVIKIDLREKTLQLSSTKEVSGAKKFSVRVTYTDNLKMVLAKNESSVTALSTMKLNDFTFKSFDKSKIYAYVEAPTFTLMANDKSKIELNLTSDLATIELSKNVVFRGLINSKKLTFDMYQKSSASVEGFTNELTLRTDNDSDFVGNNLISKTAEITVESYSDCTIQVSNKAIISAAGNSELKLYGDTKTIEIIKFTDKATIYKKALK